MKAPSSVLRRLGAMLLLGMLIGVAESALTRLVSIAQPVQAQAQSQEGPAQSSMNPQWYAQPYVPVEPPPRGKSKTTPPVPNPPLYPLGVGKAHYFSAENARALWEKKRDEIYKNLDSPNDLSLPGAGATVRWNFERLRPGKWSHVLSHFSDADIHQNVTDLMCFVAGTGEMIVDGDIVNRVYGAKQLNGKTVFMIGEFNGQPVKNGKVLKIRPGDWVMIPPNVEHQYTPDRGQGYAYWHITMDEVMYGGHPFTTY